jgi:DNA-binding MarR family transcriptional regulator
MSLFTDILTGLPENAVLRTKIRDAETRYAALETENAIFKDDLRDAKAKINQLEEQIEKLTHVDLGDSEVNLLKAVARPERNPYAEALAQELQVHQQRVERSLSKLVESGYIQRHTDRLRYPAYYSVTDKGRDYLIDHDLI